MTVCSHRDLTRRKRCGNDVVPGLVVCLDHASKDALWMLIQCLLADDRRKEAGKPRG